MRGFRDYYKKELRIGLNPSKMPMRNTAALSESMNIRVTKEGLEGYIPAIHQLMPISDGIGGYIDTSVSWPFPQMHLGPSYLFIATRTGFWACYWTSIGGPHGYWGGSKIFEGLMPWRWPYTFIDHSGSFWVFCSGDCLFFYLPDAGSGGAGSVVVQYAVNDNLVDGGGEWVADGAEYWGNPLSVCSFRGQILLGGNRAFDIFGSNDNECRSIRWSAIGEFKFLGTKDGSGTYDRRVIPDAGQLFVPGPRENRVYRLLPLRDHVIAYCSYGVVALTPAMAGQIPTFKSTPLSIPGVAGVYAASGNEDKHMVIDRTGDLWLVFNDLSYKRIGYGNILADITGHRANYLEGVQPSRGMVHTVYNPIEDEWYLSDGYRSFLLSSDFMLTETSRCVLSLIDVRNTFVENYQTIDSHSLGIYKDTGEKWAYFTTDILDMNNNMLKTIESVELGGSLPYNALVEVCADWRNDRRDQWRRTEWRRVNPKGVGNPIVTGSELRLCVRVRPFDGLKVDYISVSWKQSDRSQIRGAYAFANQAATNAGGGAVGAD